MVLLLSAVHSMTQIWAFNILSINSDNKTGKAILRHVLVGSPYRLLFVVMKNVNCQPFVFLNALIIKMQPILSEASI